MFQAVTPAEAELLHEYCMNTKLLKLVADLVVLPLNVIFNACVSKGVFPDVRCKIIPVYKNGNVDGLNKYRLIFFSPMLSKILLLKRAF